MCVTSDTMNSQMPITERVMKYLVSMLMHVKGSLIKVLKWKSNPLDPTKLNVLFNFLESLRSFFEIYYIDVFFMKISKEKSYFPRTTQSSFNSTWGIGYADTW